MNGISSLFPSNSHPLDKKVHLNLPEAKQTQILGKNPPNGLRLDDLSTNPKNMAKMNAWIKNQGTPPANKLTELMQKNAVIIIGEQHDKNPHRQAGARYIEALKKGGMTHLALEMDPKDQEGLDNFMRTGEETLPMGALEDKGYMDMLKKARALGIKLVAVDSKNYRNRNQVMANGIIDLLQENPKAKVVLWVGDAHSSKAFNTDGAANDWLSVPDFIKQDPKVNAKGVISISAFFDRNSAPWLNQIKKPVMVPSKGSPYFMLELTTRNADDLLSISLGKSADYQIFYPPSKN